MSNNKKNAGRKQNEVTEKIKQEAQEILDLALKDVGCVKGKITYNSVVKFNNDIANNPRYLRENGEYFNFLGDRFWSKTYNNKPYYGRLIIDKLKSNDDIKTGGEAFDINNKDIESLVDRYHTKPEELKKRLINLFSKDRNEILSLKVRNDKLTSKLVDKEKSIKQFEEGFATMFWNSASTYNSLDDVLTLERPEDGQVNEELLNMFNGDKDKMQSLLNKTKIDVISEKTSETSKNNPGELANTTQSKNKSKSDIHNAGVLSISDRLKVLGLSSSEDEGF